MLSSKITKFCFVCFFLFFNLFSNFIIANIKEEIVVISKKIESINDWSENSSFFSLSSEELNRIDPQHPKQIFQRVPGMWVSRGSGQEHLTGIRSPILTGPGACGAFLLLEDGIPVRPKGFCNVNGLLEIYTEGAKSIEIIKGPASARFGGNALHGVINIVSSEMSDQGRLSSSLGPNGYKNIKSSFGMKEEWKINSYLSKTNGIRRDSGLDQQKMQIKTKLHFKSLEGYANLSATNLNQETAGYIYGLDAYKDSQKVKLNSNPGAFRDANAIRFNLQLKKKDKANFFSFTPYIRKSSMEFLQHYLPGSPLENNKHSSLGIILTNVKKNEGMEFIYGGQIEFADVELLQFQRKDLTTSSPFNNAVRPQGLHYNYQVDSKVIAFFSGFKKEKLTASTSSFGDVRVEQLHYSYKNRMVSGNTKEDGSPCAFGGCFYNRPEDRQDTYKDISFRLGIEKKIDLFSLFSQISSGFRPPQINEAYRLQKKQSVSDLNSEQLIMLEGGINFQLNNINGMLSIYKGRKKDSIFRDANNFIVDDGQSNHSGLEFFGTVEFTRNLLYLALAFEEHKYNFNSVTSLGEQISKGNYIDTSPKFKGNLRWVQNFNDFLLAELEIENLSDYYTDASNNHKYEGHTLMHLRTSYILDSNLTIYFRINNLLNKKYAERADFNTFGGDRYFPGIPREAYISLEYTF